MSMKGCDSLLTYQTTAPYISRQELRLYIILNCIPEDGHGGIVCGRHVPEKWTKKYVQPADSIV